MVLARREVALGRVCRGEQTFVVSVPQEVHRLAVPGFFVRPVGESVS